MVLSPNRRSAVAVSKLNVLPRIFKPYEQLWVYSKTRCFAYPERCKQRWKFMKPFSTKTVHTDDVNVEKFVTHVKQESPKHIAVMTGAGLSTASGIPDFRSPGSGLYDNLKDYDLPYPEAVFDIGYFYQRPEAFYRLAKELYPSGQYRPNLGHYFLRLLQEKNILHCLFTQNIDGLERMAGIKEDNLVEAHGSFHTATCMRCRRHYKGEDIKEDILLGRVPKCVQDNCSGVIKPDVVFFGENLPAKFHTSTDKIATCDLLIIIGTSLEVHPFASLSTGVTGSTLRVLFNNEASGTFVDFPRKNDLFIQGDIVENLKKVASLLNWTADLDNLINLANYGLDNSTDA